LAILCFEFAGESIPVTAAGKPFGGFLAPSRTGLLGMDCRINRRLAIGFLRMDESALPRRDDRAIAIKMKTISE
jgi:hypothetical protein